jgi:hypothetical protein
MRSNGPKLKATDLSKAACVVVLLIGSALNTHSQPTGATTIQGTLAPLPITNVEDSTLAAGWKRYQFGKPVLFTAVLPSAPEYQSQTLAPEQGSLRLRIYMTSNSTGVFGLNYIESPQVGAFKKSEAATRGFFNTYITGFIKGFKESMEAAGFNNLATEISPERRVRISGLDGYEQDIVIGPTQGRMQVVFLGQYVYAAVAFWTAEGPLSEPTAFFNSFQVHRRR